MPKLTTKQKAEAMDRKTSLLFKARILVEYLHFSLLKKFLPVNKTQLDRYLYNDNLFFTTCTLDEFENGLNRALASKEFLTMENAIEILRTECRGTTARQIANKLGVSLHTIYRWRDGESYINRAGNQKRFIELFQNHPAIYSY